MDPTYQQSGHFHTSGSSNSQDMIPELSSSSVYSLPNSASTAFGPGNVFGGMFPDLAFTCSDQTVYYVHRHHLSRISTNAFAGLLTNAAFSISVLEPATVLNTVIHTIYGMSCTHHNPSLDTIEAVLVALVKYGLAPHFYAVPSRPIYPLLLLHAPHQPIDAYALAGKYSLEDAAVTISGHLLAFDLWRITDELSIKMGPVYLRRLVDLHRDRANALKSIALRPPSNHPPTLMCGEMSQARLINAWAFAAAQLAWATLPSMSTNALQSTFEKAGKEIVCDDCWAALRARIQEVCWQWSEVKRTI
ncbi:hypothetical protein LXA43DRAFT_436990 [Ganoderma leucocontextum]|nr:hypothetical protein LXA43DRAFT_436990 [Ganoderma leucocontextum]